MFALRMEWIRGYEYPTLHFRPILRQPLLAGLEVRHGALDPQPEVRCVVGLVEVDQLVDDHVRHLSVPANSTF
jgi:hypothetical protein